MRHPEIGTAASSPLTPNFRVAEVYRELFGHPILEGLRYTNRWISQPPPKLDVTIETLYRSESGRVLATLVPLLGDLDVAEEAMHEAFAAALQSWPQIGIPDHPRPWLIARFKAIDAMRRRARFNGAQRDLIAHTPRDKGYSVTGRAIGPESSDQCTVRFTARGRPAPRVPSQ